MAKIAALVAFLCAAGVSAFVGQTSVSRGARSVRMAADLLGADVETFGIFDPLGFSKDASKVAQYRAIELKHGRVSMLAVVGQLVVNSGIHLPDPVFSETKPISALIRVATERPLALIQIIAAIAWIELVAGKQDPSKAPGDLAKFGDQFKPVDEEEYAELQLKELKNGRLAQLAIIAEIVQEALSGKGIFDQIASL